MSGKQQAPTTVLASKVVFAALEALRDAGGELRSRDAVAEVEKRVEFNDWERERYEKTGYIRWQSILHFFTIDCVKAGYMIKKKGTWYLTEEGEQALALGADKLLESARAAYRIWKAEQPSPEDVESEIAEEEIDAAASVAQIEQLAREGIEAEISKLNPYEFQDLAAALLRGMGYHTPFVAPRGKDGGVDIIAYRDPLGTVSPRIKVQVKHRSKTAVSVTEIRQLMGILQKDGDVGIFISTGGFTSDSRISARESHVHVELIDLSRFIDLWVEFYPILEDEDKALMALQPVYFVAPEE